MKKIVRKIIKKVWGIDGISLFIKKQKRKLFKGIYRQRYSVEDLTNKMCDMGMKEGSVVFIHSAMTEFYNFTGTAEELIEKIMSIIGDEGTLMMPAYPKNKSKLYQLALENSDNIVFDINTTPSGAGYLTEVFRTYPGVKRSVNLQHAVCAYGKLADYFVSEHHLSKIAWDEYSPYYKMTLQNCLIFSLGLEPYLRNVTMIHCVETVFRDKYLYFSSFFGKEIKYKFVDSNNNEGVQELMIPIKGGVRSKSIIKKHFNSDCFKRTKISNLLIEVIDSKYMFEKCVELVDRGVSIYEKPDYNGYMKGNRFLKKYHN